MIRDTVIWPGVGCGYCCITRTCTFGASRHPGAQNQVCPKPHWDGHCNICRLMRARGWIGDFYRAELHCGNGCVSSLNLWRRDVRQRTPEEIAALEKD